MTPAEQTALIAKIKALDAEKPIHPVTMKLVSDIIKRMDILLSNVFGERHYVERFGEDGLSLIKESDLAVLRVDYWGHGHSNASIKHKEGVV